MGSGVVVLKVLVINMDCQQKNEKNDTLRYKKSNNISNTLRYKKSNNISRALLGTKFNSTEKRHSYQTLPYGKIDCSLKSTEVTKQRKLQLLAKSEQSAEIKLNENSVIRSFGHLNQQQIKYH